MFVLSVSFCIEKYKVFWVEKHQLVQVLKLLPVPASYQLCLLYLCYIEIEHGKAGTSIWLSQICLFHLPDLYCSGMREGSGLPAPTAGASRGAEQGAQLSTECEHSRHQLLGHLVPLIRYPWCSSLANWKCSQPCSASFPSVSMAAKPWIPHNTKHFYCILLQH